MTSKSWKTQWVRGGRVTESAWIGTNVLAWCSGTNIIFYDIVKKTRTIRQCTSQTTGEGACCISGHPVLNVFAYSEKSAKPRIFICSYPSMDKNTECLKGCQLSYLATAFAADNHLLSLSSFPDFLLTVWNWRTGEKLISARSSITDAECFSQCLRVSSQKPTFVAQLGWTSGCVNIWEMTEDKETVYLAQNQVQLPGNALAQGISWNPYGKNHVLAIADRDGHVYLCNQFGSAINRIVFSLRCGSCTEIEPAAICWYRQGIVLKTTFCQIRFYKKNPATKRWRQEWMVQSNLKPCVLTSVPTERDQLFYFTREGYLRRLSFVQGQNDPSDDIVLHYGSKIEQIDLIYPWGLHLVMLDDLKSVTVVNSISGVVTKEIDKIEGNVECVRSHLEYPLIVMTSDMGEISILSLEKPEKPKMILYCFLQSTKLDIIKFTQCGRFILVASKTDGLCFCIDLFHQGKIKILTRLVTDLKIVDIIFYTESNIPKLAILSRSDIYKSSGKNLSFYEFNEKTNQFDDTENNVELSFPYQSLNIMHEKNLEVIGSPYFTRFLCKMDITDQKTEKIVDAVSTNHQVRLSKIFVDKNWITSGALDGCSVVRKVSNLSAVTILKHHHRRDLGAVKIVMNSSGHFVASLGQDGSVVAQFLSDEKAGKNILNVEKFKSKISQDYYSGNKLVVEMLNSKVEPFRNDNNEIISWSDWIELQQEKEDRETFLNEKTEHVNDLRKLKEKIKNMIDENEKCPKAEQLYIAKFDLDWLARERKKKIAIDEQENTRLGLEAKCEAYEEVTLLMKNNYWNSQTVLAKSLCSMFGDFEVTNYALYEYNLTPSESFEYCNFLRNVDSDAVCPYRSYTTDELNIATTRQIRMSKIDMSVATIGFGDDSLFSKNQTFFKGSTAHNFVVQSPVYPQFEAYSYAHTFINSVMIAQDCIKLRLHFNGIFDKVFEIKERELKLTRDKIEQVMKINSELNSMFNQSVPVIPKYPDWKAQEKPESMIVVEDHEVPVEPYLSPSEENLLRQQGEDVEALRLQMLADDFCDRALNEMMDGVLEVRWEDIIKKDIPVPECINKDPKELTEEEIQIIEQYEKDVEHLKNDREKYRKILESRYEKTMSSYENGVKKFHSRLQDLLRSKMEVQAAILELYLRFVREELRHVSRLEHFKNDDTMREEIERKRDLITDATKKLKTVTTLIPELHYQKAVLMNQAETVDKKFKSKFTSLGKRVYRTIETIYKKRPRGIFKDFSNAVLSDLIKVLSGTKKLSYLPEQFNSFSNSLHAFDVRPDTIPSEVTATLWNELIIFRRQKIILELSLRGIESRIREKSSVEIHYRKTINECRWAIAALHKQRDKMKNDRAEFDLNVEMQLVTKNGQNELSGLGSRDDASNAVFIHRNNIEAINKLVLAAGDKKLFTMEKIVPLRKDILYFEWWHRYLKAFIEDLQEDLHDVQRTTVTKSMQLILQRIDEELSSKPKRKIDRKLKAKMVIRCLEHLLECEKTKLIHLELKIKSIEEENASLDEKAASILKHTCNCDSSDEIISKDEVKRLLDLKVKLLMYERRLQRQIQQNEIKIQNDLLKFGKSEKNCVCLFNYSA